MVDQDCVLSALRVEGNELPHPYTHGFGHVLILASRSCTSAQPRAPSSMPFSVSVMSSFPCPIQPWVANCPHRGILLLRHAQASPICCGGGFGAGLSLHLHRSRYPRLERLHDPGASGKGGLRPGGPLPCPDCVARKQLLQPVPAMRDWALLMQSISQGQGPGPLPLRLLSIFPSSQVSSRVALPFGHRDRFL